MRAGARGSAAIGSLARRSPLPRTLRRRSRSGSSAVPDYDPLTISDEELKALPPSDRAKVYKARAQARAGGAAPVARPAPPAAATPPPAAAAGAATTSVPPGEGVAATAGAPTAGAPTAGVTAEAPTAGAPTAEAPT